MRLSIGSILSAFFISLYLGFGAGWLNPACAKEELLPSLPKHYVLDQPGVLSPSMTQALQRLLIEHDHLTGQQLIFAIFSELNGDDAKKQAQEIFTHWKLGQGGNKSGLLLVLFWKEQKPQIVLSYGLDSSLSETQTSQIINQFLIPELENRTPDRALALTAVEILRSLESPLIQNQKAQELLESGGFKGKWRPHKNAYIHWSFWLSLGLGLMGATFNFLTSAEAHFSKDGWYRPRPWKKLFSQQRPSRTAPEGGTSGAW